MRLNLRSLQMLPEMATEAEAGLHQVLVFFLSVCQSIRHIRSTEELGARPGLTARNITRLHRVSECAICSFETWWRSSNSYRSYRHASFSKVRHRLLSSSSVVVGNCTSLSVLPLPSPCFFLVVVVPFLRLLPDEDLPGNELSPTSRLGGRTISR